MRKTYKKPQITIIKMDSVQLLSGSDTGIKIEGGGNITDNGETGSAGGARAREFRGLWDEDSE